MRQAWIYRDWQQAIGDVMIRDIKGPVRRFDIIGYGEFEALLRSATRAGWIVCARWSLASMSRSDPSDLRLPTASPVCPRPRRPGLLARDLDLERRILDPQACQLARKFLATLPATAQTTA